MLARTIISNPGPLIDCLTCIRFLLNADRSKSKHVLFISDWLVYHIGETAVEDWLTACQLTGTVRITELNNLQQLRMSLELFSPR